MPNAAIRLHDFLFLPWELSRGALVEDMQGLHEVSRELQNAVFGDTETASAVQLHTTSATSENNFQLATSTEILIVSTTTAVFSGFAGVEDGRQVVLVYKGSGTCKILHQSSSSIINYRVICPSTGGLIVGANGCIQLVYDAAVQQWRAFTLSAGTPITPTFTAGDYTAATGNWTVASGDVTKLTYQQINKRVTVDFELVTTTVSATPASLNRAVPGGFTITSNSYNPCLTNDNGTKAIGVIKAEQSSNLLKFYPTGALGAWAAATDTTGVAGQITFEVN